MGYERVISYHGRHDGRVNRICGDSGLKVCLYTKGGLR